MSKTATILFALCTLFCSACSWVDDDRSDCPTGCWLKLSYTYNMLNVDAVTTQVKDVTLFILDQEGNYIVREEVDSLTFHQNECTIQVPCRVGQGHYCPFPPSEPYMKVSNHTAQAVLNFYLIETSS